MDTAKGGDFLLCVFKAKLEHIGCSTKTSGGLVEGTSMARGAAADSPSPQLAWLLRHLRPAAGSLDSGAQALLSLCTVWVFFSMQPD